MTGREKLLARMEANAESFCEAYPTSAALLQTAMMEALPWVIQLKSQGKAPNKLQLERLGTQILAILLASLPPEDAPFGNLPASDNAEQNRPLAERTPESAPGAASWPVQRGQARMHSFK